jgi:phage virion morphogenesis protein
MIIARFESSRFEQAIKDLKDRSVNLSAPLRSCGEVMMTSVDRNFQIQGRYSGQNDARGGSTRWKDLAPATKLARLGGSKAFTKKGSLRASAQRHLASLKILQVRGRLAASITYAVSGNTLTIGSNVIYAAIHNFGGMAGRGRSVQIPARPFLVVQDQDIDDMITILQKHLF